MGLPPLLQMGVREGAAVGSDPATALPDSMMTQCYASLPMAASAPAAAHGGRNPAAKPAAIWLTMSRAMR